MIIRDDEIDKARLIIWHTVEELPELEKSLRHPENIRLYHKLASDKRKKEFLAVRSALKNAAGEEIVIHYHSSGKPFLPEKHYKVSLSHSEHWVALLLHPDCEVGVDIEVFRPKIEKLYTRFLSEKEQHYLYDPNDISKLRIAWSVKEALYKIIGEEAVDFATQLEIKPFTLERKGQIEAVHLVSHTIYTLFYELTDNYVLAYCINTN